MTTRISALFFGLIGLAVIGEVILLVASFAPVVGANPIGSYLWYLFSFTSGAGLSGLSFALPLAVFIIPVMARSGFARGVFAFTMLSLGLFSALVLTGLLVSFFGREALALLSVVDNTLKYWIYISAGAFIYVLALGELGLVRFRLSSYTGRIPGFARDHHVPAAAFFLGIFFGTIGVLSAYPVVSLLFVEAATSGSVLFGMSLFAFHALGRITLLFVLSVLVLAGIDTLGRLFRHRAVLFHMNGVVTLCVASFVLTLGLFSHGWWEGAILYTWLATLFHVPLAPSSTSSFLAPPLSLGAFFFAALLLLPLWWSYWRARMRIMGNPTEQITQLIGEIDDREALRRRLEMSGHRNKEHFASHLRHLEHEIDTLEKKRRIFEDAGRYVAASRLAHASAKKYEREALHLRFLLTLLATFAIGIIAIVML
jgi:hypothetical protein